MKLKNIFYFLFLSIFLTSCASGAKGYKRKKKKGCDCPSWSMEQKQTEFYKTV